MKHETWKIIKHELYALCKVLTEETVGKIVLLRTAITMPLVLFQYVYRALQVTYFSIPFICYKDSCFRWQRSRWEQIAPFPHHFGLEKSKPTMPSLFSSHLEMIYLSAVSLSYWLWLFNLRNNWDSKRDISKSKHLEMLSIGSVLFRILLGV